MDNNTQVLVDKGEMLPLMESFYTIQGEGFHKGTAAYFIRLGGCDVGCHWCDVKESWDALLHPPTLTTEIVENTKNFSDTVVITGGEPLMWDMTMLTKLLNAKNKSVHLTMARALRQLQLAHLKFKVKSWPEASSGRGELMFKVGTRAAPTAVSAIKI